MLQIFIWQNSFTARKEIQTDRFGLELTCNVKSSSHWQELHFVFVDPTPNGIFLSSSMNFWYCCYPQKFVRINRFNF